MSNRAGAVLAGILIGLAVATVLPGPLTIAMAVLGVVGGVILGTAFAAVLIAQSRGEAPEAVAQEIIKQATVPDTGSRERVVHEQLVRTNQRLRLDRQLSGTVLGAFESLIDEIREIIPQALELAPGSEATFDIEQLGTQHLPQYAGDFLELAPESRRVKEESLLEQLRRLSVAVQAANRALEEGRLSDFEAQSAFINMKFTNNQGIES